MLKVMIAEDELLVADMVEEALVDNGYDVCGIARSVAEAVALGRRHSPDLAIIDLRLAGGGFGTQIAAQLGGPGRFGILYASGNIPGATLDASNGEGCLTKPYSSTDLLRGLAIVTEIMTTGKAVPPFPRGFRLLTRDVRHRATLESGAATS